MPASSSKLLAAGRDSGFTFSETYQLYNEQARARGLNSFCALPRSPLLCARVQLHYARATYTREQLDKWQADWNAYFVRFGMEIPPYAHKVSGVKMPVAAETNGTSNLLAA